MTTTNLFDLRMAWNSGKQGVSPKKKTKKTHKTKKRIATKMAMLADRAAKRRKRK